MFGRRRKRGRHSAGAVDTGPEHDEVFEDVEGPWDSTVAPRDDVQRLDLGSVLLPMPDEAQLQVEMDQQSGAVRAVHVLTSVGQLTVSAFAAPKSGGLWKEVGAELIAGLKEDGARINRENGEWGEEITARNQGVQILFIGVDGPRWMLRGVAAGPEEHFEQNSEALRQMLRGTVVVRGDQPMPPRTPLPVELPEAIARHIQQQG
ncbi:DUF3710 domain-containing protein [Lentzea flava]|uniref:DUF3710 domain-containing protein n=1 Tax=Lentzea flava TaxID=103732 RepID=A0ABQ2UT82_9PSEU|nr:DUF3710 domain-containing protein [Lentzea flava]MCP2201470.1 Protein of unknown function (DUF3710) [Lentzea flava]GGU52651.1 hypothetical protein GCM10010178_51790 [Lentzea flava]